MPSARFTLRLEPDLKDWLEDEARRQERSAGFLANKAIETLRHDTEVKRQAIEAAMAEAEKGEFISEAGADPTILMAEVDLSRSEHVRRIWPFLRDRRIDAYGDLLKRYRD